MSSNKLVKSIIADGYRFDFFGFKFGILYSIDGKEQYPYYFDNMRNTLNYAWNTEN